MRFRFFVDTGEESVAKSFEQGCLACGHELQVAPARVDAVFDGDFDVGIFIGVKSAAIKHALDYIGRQWLYLDIPYSRERNGSWYKVSPCAHQPTYLFDHIKSPATRRMETTDWTINCREHHGDSILIIGASPGYHMFKGLKDCTSWVTDVVDEIRKYSSDPIIYRCKPTWTDMCHIDGTEFSNCSSIADDYSRARVVVLYGSGAAFECLREGIPCIVLGDGVTRPISSVSLRDINRPRKAGIRERFDILNKVAYFQWSLLEISNGTALPYIVYQLDVAKKIRSRLVA